MIQLTISIVFDATGTVLESRNVTGDDLGQLEALAVKHVAQYRPRWFADGEDSAHIQARIVEQGQHWQDGRVFMTATPWEEESFDGEPEFGWSIQWPFDSATVATR